MKLTPLFFAFLLFFTGCSQKQNFQTLINEDRVYTHAVGYTKKAVLQKDGISIAVATITYLNSLYGDRFSDGEYFFVGLQLEDGENILSQEVAMLYLDNPQSLQFSAHKRVDDFYAKPTQVIPVEKDQFLELPLRNSWSDYYIVKFEKTDPNILRVRFGSDLLGFEHLVIIKDRERN